MAHTSLWWTNWLYHPIIVYEELNFWATLWKKTDEYGFLAKLPSQVLQQKLKDLEAVRL
jgi:hypothetical protein